MDNTNTQPPNDPIASTDSKAHGSKRVIQPSRAFVEEIHNQKQSEVPVSAEVPTKAPEAIDATYPKLAVYSTYQPHGKTKRNRTIFIASALVLVLIITGGLGVFLLRREILKEVDTPTVPSKKSNPVSEPIDTSESLTAFEKKLASSPEYLEFVQSFPLAVYVPTNKKIGDPVIGVSNNNGKQKYFVVYGINPKFGQGLVPGTFDVSTFTLDSDFNPPSDCGLPLGGKASSPIACTAYDGATADMPAYIYNDQQPGAIQNTDVPEGTYMTLFVKRGEQVLTIQSSGTTASELYKMATSMKEIDPIELPEGTLVSF